MSNTCQVLDCPPIPFYSYTIQGVLPTPSPPIPAAFYNQQVVVVVCEEGDEPTFSGELPGWIQFSSEDRQFIGAAGVWGGVTQAAANASAQSELDAFATAHAGEVVCSPLLFEWQSTVIQGDGTASFTPLDFETGDEAHGTAELPDPPPGTAAASFNATGTLIWNSDVVVPASMHIISVGAEGGGTIADWQILLNVVAPATILLDASKTSLGLNSVTDVPFNLPDTGGADWTLEWLVIGLVDTAGFDPGSLDLTATVEIV